jgi:regulatory protein
MRGMGEETINAALIERWALAYLGRFASTAENLRRVLLRRVRRRLGEDREGLADAAALVDGLVARYRASGLVDDASYAAGHARARLRRGQSSPAASGWVHSAAPTHRNWAAATRNSPPSPARGSRAMSSRPCWGAPIRKRPSG